MASTFTSLTCHVVFGTKYRRNTIAPELRDDLYRYTGGIIRSHKGVLLEVGGMPDHVHLLVGFSPTMAVSDMLRLIKSNSSKWVNERPGRIDRFEWQTGFAAFSVSHSQVDVVRRYIQNQERHHTERSFREEFLTLLRKHDIEFDERYVFEKEHSG